MNNLFLFSPISDLLGINPEDIVARLEQWGIHCRLSTVSRVLDVMIIVAIMAALYFAWRGLTYKQRRYVRERIGAENAQYNSRVARWLFVDTYYLENPLSDFDSPERVLKQKGNNLIKMFTHTVFKEQGGNSLHLVLGGSGMGKSAFLVGLLRKYVMHNPLFRRYEITLVYLGRDDCIQRISSIGEKANTILLLDALDENRSAAASLNSFMSELEKVISDFPITVITCRTQFFPSQSDELQTAEILQHGRYKDKLQYRHYYIRYFDNWDVQKYLLKKYPLNIFNYYKAKKAVSLCYSLAHRPLLLSYIDDLIKEKAGSLNNELELYERLISLWYRREAAFLSSSNVKSVVSLLDEFSILLAEKMYRDYPQKRDYCVTGIEADSILGYLGIHGANHAFKSRSLVERDAEGNYKFAHRTFMEFFLAKKAFLDESFPPMIVGLDSVGRFFKQFAEHHLNEQEAAGYIIRGESEPLINIRDQIDIKSMHGGLTLKALLAFQEVRVLSFDFVYLKEVLRFIDSTSVHYLRITGYKKNATTSLNTILLHPQIKYIWIDGECCSRSFLKLASKQEVSVIVNDDVALYYERPGCPMDFLASTLVVENNDTMILQFLDHSENYDE